MSCAAILGRTHLLKRQIDQPDWTASLDVIEQAALDGAATVRRIQEFSRQQPDPDARDQVADLDQVVRDTIAQTLGSMECMFRWTGAFGFTARWCTIGSSG